MSSFLSKIFISADPRIDVLPWAADWKENRSHQLLLERRSTLRHCLPNWLWITLASGKGIWLSKLQRVFGSWLGFEDSLIEKAALDPEELKGRFQRDLKVLKREELWWFILGFWSIIGLPIGEAPQSETAFGLDYFVFLVTIIFSSILWFIPWLISLIPGVSLFFHLISVWETFAGRGGNPNNYHGEHHHQTEKWFFVNGICTTKASVRKNQARLEQLFGKNVGVIYNPTQGIYLDLLECLTGRTFGIFSPPALLVFRQISQALLDPVVTKVVLICHSQGVIIVSQFLKDLEQIFKEKQQEKNGTKKTEQEAATELGLAKLEVYTFASPALEFPDFGGKIHIENFANEYDAVARIGILDDAGEKSHGGLLFLGNFRNGHLLNEHYLDSFDSSTYINPEKEESRLIGYIKK